LIELSFDLFAETINQPYLFFEIVSIFTSEHIKPQKSTLLPAEKFYAYPEYPGIEKIKVKSIDDFFLKYIKEARKGGQIDKNVSNKDITRILKAILIGIPLAIEIEEFDDLAKIYKKQLMLSRKLFLKNTL
jgi:hypothetical protein